MARWMECGQGDRGRVWPVLGALLLLAACGDPSGSPAPSDDARAHDEAGTDASGTADTDAIEAPEVLADADALTDAGEDADVGEHTDAASDTGDTLDDTDTGADSDAGDTVEDADTLEDADTDADLDAGDTLDDADTLDDTDTDADSDAGDTVEDADAPNDTDTADDTDTVDDADAAADADAARTYECGAGEWDHDDDAMTPCELHSTCESGTFVVSEGDATRDRTCAPCEPGHWVGESNSETCAAWSSCGPGTYIETDGTATADRVCTRCDAGTFTVTQDQSECTPWQTCLPGYEQATPGSAVEDRTCRDTDECLDGSNGGCSLNAACTNNVGAPPDCSCHEFYTGDGIDCVFAPCDGDTVCSGTYAPAGSPFAFECQPQEPAYTCRGMFAEWTVAHSALLDGARFVVRIGDDEIDGSTDDTVDDFVTGLQWQRFASDDRFAFVEAVAYCDELTIDGGGWRLPEYIELFSLMLLDVGISPMISPFAFPGTPVDRFWTATAFVAQPNHYRVVNFGGLTEWAVADTRYLVRCVR